MVAAATLLLAACGGADDEDGATAADGGEDGAAEAGEDLSQDDLVAAAEEEGTLLWYSSLPEAVNDSVVSGFEEQYDIDVDYLRLVDGQLTQRFASEQSSGSSEVDFMNVAQRAFYTAALDEGWFATLDSSQVPSLGDWPEEAFFEDTYALINVQPLGFAYNTDLVDSAPTDWSDLTSEEFADGTLFGDPAIPAYLVLYDLWREELGDDYLEQLDALGLRVVDSMVPGAQQLGAGEASMTIPALASVVQPMIDAGAPIEFVVPATTTGVEQYGAVVENAPNHNSARLFMDYLLSAEGQQRLTAGLAASYLEDVDGAMELPADYQRPREAEALEREDETVALLGL